MIELTALFHRPDSSMHIYIRKMWFIFVLEPKGIMYSQYVYTMETPLFFTNKAINTKQKWKL
jgi:hypothetical protein